ncbi:MAG: lipoyl(octanoyl) transferase LipB [Candidatus Omnitrophota bacterium]
MEFKVFDLGLVDFQSAWMIQKEIFEDVKTGVVNSALVLCRHYPVITLGRQADKENILVSADSLKTRSIAVYEIERGGDVTYHGPGQITVYPVFNLRFYKKDIHLFLRQLERIVIDLLADFGIIALRYQGMTGVWIGEQKISSIGITIKNWITFHGMTINIKRDDLNNFSLIRPCGMDIKMTSLEDILQKDVEIDNIKNKLIEFFKEAFKQGDGDDKSSATEIRGRN